MQFDVRSNIREVSRWLTDAERKQVPFATVLALTMTAKDIKAEEIVTMRRVFDRPTPYTINALQATPARKSSPIASVEFKQGATSRTDAKRFLNPEVHGGTRSRKSSERQISPLIKSNNRFAMPGKDMPKDAYGNMTGGTFRKIISQLKVSRDATANASNSKKSKRKRKASAYFVKGNIVYERKGKGIKPALVFTSAPQYRQRFPFYAVAERVMATRFNANFDTAFQRAMANSHYKSAKGGKWR